MKIDINIAQWRNFVSRKKAARKSLARKAKDGSGGVSRI